jgi:hypothetical protein
MSLLGMAAKILRTENVHDKDPRILLVQELFPTEHHFSFQRLLATGLLNR